MAQSDIARFPSGVNNMPENSGLADLKWPNPLLYNLMYDDFNAFTATDWTLVGAGAAAFQPNADGGVVSLATSATINTEQSMAFGAPTLTITPSITKDLVMSARVQLDDVINGGIFFGLGSADGDPLTTPPNDGMYFRKLTGVDIGQFTVRVGGTNIFNVDFQLPLSGTWYELTMAYSAEDGVMRAYAGNTAARVATNPTAGQLPSVPLGLMFAVRNQTAAIRTILIDNYLVAKAR